MDLRLYVCLYVGMAYIKFAGGLVRVRSVRTHVQPEGNMERSSSDKKCMVTEVIWYRVQQVCTYQAEKGYKREREKEVSTAIYILLPFELPIPPSLHYSSYIFSFPFYANFRGMLFILCHKQ